MNVLILGASGFIGTNLVAHLLREGGHHLHLFDRLPGPYHKQQETSLPVSCHLGECLPGYDYKSLTQGMDLVFHLASTTHPGNSNLYIDEELQNNVITATQLLAACAESRVKKVVFLSSGGTVYGKAPQLPIPEDAPTNPITSYGLQKLAIEKLLYLYHHLHGLDYRIIRLANPYGPHQNPFGGQGVVTCFTYKAIRQEPVQMFGDGSVVRDYIYIDDAIQGILRIAKYGGEEKLFNLGSGQGHSLMDIIQAVEDVTGQPLAIQLFPARNVDVPVNILDISRYRNAIGLEPSVITLKEGIQKTAEFLSYM